MRYASFVRPDGTATWGPETGAGLLDAPAAGAALGTQVPSSLLDLIRLGPDQGRGAVDGLIAAGAGALAPHTHDRAKVRLLAPLPVPPRNVIALGLNYHDHAAESRTGLGSPDLPVYFTKANFPQ